MKSTNTPKCPVSEHPNFSRSYQKPKNPYSKKQAFQEESISDGFTQMNNRLNSILMNHKMESATTAETLKSQNTKLEFENSKLLEMVESIKREMSQSQISNKVNSVNRQQIFEEISTEILRKARPQISQQIEDFCLEIQKLGEILRESELQLKETDCHTQVNEKTATNAFMDGIPNLNLALGEIYQSQIKEQQTGFWSKQKSLEVNIGQLEQSVEMGLADLQNAKRLLGELLEERKRVEMGLKVEESRFLVKRQKLDLQKKEISFEKQKHFLETKLEHEKSQIQELEKILSQKSQLDFYEKEKNKRENEEKHVDQERELQEATLACQKLENDNFGLRNEVEKIERENTVLQSGHIKTINEAYQNELNNEDKIGEQTSAFSFAEAFPNRDMVAENEAMLDYLQKRIRDLREDLWNNKGGTANQILIDLKVQVVNQLEKLTELRTMRILEGKK